jgi:hypothetical protein
MSKFMQTEYKKVLYNYLYCKDIDSKIGYYKTVSVRTYTSVIHETLNALFSRIRIFDYSNSKHIHVILQIYNKLQCSSSSSNLLAPEKNNTLLYISYVHYHSIGMEPLSSVIIPTSATQTRYDATIVV